MIIAVDAMGGDKAPDSIVEGALSALGEMDTLKGLVLTGDEQRIKQLISNFGYAEDKRITVIHAESVVTMEDPPTAALRSKKDSSISRAIDHLKDGKCDAVISAGNTGASVAACVFKLRTLEGVDRPAIATVIPTPKGSFVLLDSGATADVKPETLAQFAVMGDVYARILLGRDNPRIGLLSNGTEDGKGNAQTKKTFKLLTTSELNFVGNVEGHDLFNGDVDVCVCDGFVGNIVLKICESMAKGFGRMLKDNMMKNPVRKLGAVLAKGAFDDVKKSTDYSETGGAPLLGVNGTFFKAHGSSNATAIKNAVKVTAKFVQQQANEKIVEGVEKLKLS